jgi:hypothetical protein
MLNIRDHSTGELFNRWGHLGRNRVKRLQSSWAEVFRTHVLPKLPAEELSKEFDPVMGRPTMDLAVVLGAIILQQMFNLTDSETVEAIGFNITWHYALDVRSDSDLEMTDRTLRSYRRLLIERGLDEAIFRDITDGLIKALGLDTSKQRIDSTAFKSAMRELTRLGTFVETISKFLRELKRKAPTEYERVDPEVAGKYAERGGEGCFGVRPTESGKRLPEAAEMLRELIGMFRGTPAEEIESYGLMERVFEEQCEVVEEGNIRIRTPGEIGCGNMHNPSDPDSTYNGYKGQGYTAQVMETYTEAEHGRKTAPDIITYVAVNKMTEMDSQALKPALEEVDERGIKPETVVADTPYGANANREDASRRGVEIVAPSQPPKNYKSGMLSLEHFELDVNGFVVKCPAGHAPKTVNAMCDRIDARFEKSTCAACELRTRCPCGIQVGKGKKPRLWYRYKRVERRNRLLCQQTSEFLEKYRWRAGIEATISRLKNWLKLGNLRVRGRPAVALALRFKALGLNIFRCSAYLTI